MSIFTISDLHLSFGTDKPMNIFKGWDNHTKRLEANWKRLITNNDTVILPGDFSWGMKFSEAKPDFDFLETLPGKKILLKGNHDLWWTTTNKFNQFIKSNNYSSIDFIFNNCKIVENYAIAGTRGWFYDESSNKKVLMREVGRLEASLNMAQESGLPILLFLHYPPIYGDYVCNEIINIIEKYNIKKIYHGHIHGVGFNKSISEYNGMKLKLVSCDCVDFTPILITNI